MEKEIDNMVSLDSIDKWIAYSEFFPLNTVEDFCFGVIVGFILTASMAIARTLYGRDATEEEMKEVMNIIERRTMEIRGNIKLATSK